MTITKKFENVEKISKFPKKYIILTILSLFTLTVSEIWVSNTVIAYGEKYDKLFSLESSLTTENQVLENQIAKDSSLKVIASKSAELGFTSADSIQFIR